MARSTIYNKIVDEERIKHINKSNLELMNDFSEYLSSIDRSPKTIYNYKSDLQIFFTYVMDYLDNKNFEKISKRELSKFQNFALNDWKWSPKRIRRVKSVISSLSNYIENILDEEEQFEGFKNIVSKIESPNNAAVREKTVLSSEEVQQLLDTLVERKHFERACACAILAYSGMRKAELLQMKVEFFNDEHIVFDSLYQTENIRAKGRGKLGHQMKKWIMLKAKPYIDLWINERKEKGIENEWLFVTKEGAEYNRRLSISAFTDEFSEILNKDVYAHSFRHFTCTTLLSEYNLPSEVVRGFFQWESVEMLKIYNDKTATDDFGKYFSADGVIKQKDGTLTDLK